MPDIDTFTFNPNRVINAGEEITIRWNGERWQDQPVFGHSAMTVTATHGEPVEGEEVGVAGGWCAPMRVTYNLGAVEPEGEITAEDLRGEPARWGGFVTAPATIIRTAIREPEPANPLPPELAGENRDGANWRDMADYQAEPGPEPGDEVNIRVDEARRNFTLGEVAEALHPDAELKVELLAIAVKEVEGTTAEALEYAKAYYEWVTQ